MQTWLNLKKLLRKPLTIIIMLVEREIKKHKMKVAIGPQELKEGERPKKLK